MKISGYLQTVRPVHVTDGTDGNKTLITTEIVPSYDEEGRTTRVPFISATLLRGKLRRVASDRANEQMLRHGVSIPAETFNALRHGSHSGHMTNEPLNPSFFDAQRGHPIMGLFGGGPRQGSAGALKVAPLYPFCKEMVALGIVSDIPGSTPPRGYSLITTHLSYPKTDLVNESDPLFEVVQHKDEKIDQMLAVDVARRVKGGTEAGDSYARTSNILEHQYMIPGTFLELSLTIDDRAPDHLKGFLILVLGETLNRNEIGGMQRIGYGQDAFSLREVAHNLKINGEEIFDFDGEKLIPVSGGIAEQLIDAFLAWEDDGRAWTEESLWKATGFEGVDLSAVKVKKEGKKGKKAAPATPAPDQVETA